jgi:hypothetical protein
MFLGRLGQHVANAWAEEVDEEERDGCGMVEFTSGEGKRDVCMLTLGVPREQGDEHG